MSLTVYAQLLVIGLAAADAKAGSAWEPYPAYSSPPLVEVPTVQSVTADRELSRHWLGVAVDAGIPDGVAASLALRPWYWLRIQAGGMHNSISPGLRGGISLVPFFFLITPSLTFEAGRYFEGDATWIARRLTSNRNLDPYFRQVGYDFGNAHLGLELGSPQSVSFFLRAGISYLRMTGKGVEQALNDPSIPAGDVPQKRLIPSAKLGLLIYFL